MGFKVSFRLVSLFIILLSASILIYIIIDTFRNGGRGAIAFDREFMFFLFAGFFAQLIDGTLGMAYGICCSTLLLSVGVPPAVASASVHTAEVFTTGVSGLSHIYLKNVNKKLFFKIGITGILGAAIGAYLLSDVFNGKLIKPYISAYLFVMGVLILVKSVKKIKPINPSRYIPALGFLGGFFDALGGGGWGPIVTSNLILHGQTPKETIGTVNTAEFFVAFCSTGVFLFFIGLEGVKVILALVCGGVLSAPLGALFANRMNPKFLMRIVGVIIILASSYTIVDSLR